METLKDFLKIKTLKGQENHRKRKKKKIWKFVLYLNHTACQSKMQAYTQLNYKVHFHSFSLLKSSCNSLHPNQND